MDDETRQWLTEGIARARAGERERARESLLRVVEHDERNAQAWLWLSGVVESLEDRRVALENVLAIEPENALARAGLDWLDQHSPASTPPVPCPRCNPPRHSLRRCEGFRCGAGGALCRTCAGAGRVSLLWAACRRIRRTLPAVQAIADDPRTNYPKTSARVVTGGDLARAGRWPMWRTACWLLLR